VFCLILAAGWTQVLSAGDSTSTKELPSPDAGPVDAMKPVNAASAPDDLQHSAKAQKSEKEGSEPAVVRLEKHGSDVIPIPFQNDEELSESFRFLRLVRTHQKVGAAELGNVQEYEQALRFLEPSASDRHSLQIRPFEENAKLLKSELESMRRNASKTFFGRFPLVRAFGLWPEDDKEFQVHSYQQKGEARQRAVFSALNQIAKAASTGPLITLILVPGETVQARMESPLAQAVDAQAMEAFSSTANIVIYPGALRLAVNPMPVWTSADPAFDPICRQLLHHVEPTKDPRGVMLVLVREFVDENNDAYWIQAQQRTFEAATLEKAKEKPESLEADKIKIFDSITHDRSRFAGVIWLVAAMLLVGAFGMNRLLSAYSIHGSGGWPRLGGIPLTGFFLGLGLTSFLMSAMERWMPEPHEDAWSAAWWPLIAGSLSLMLPVGVFRLIAGSVGRYMARFSCHGRWGIAFVSVALGTSAAWIGPVFYVMGMSGTVIILGMAIVTSLMAYCFGRAIDVADDCPYWVAPIPILGSIVHGFAAFSVSRVILGSLVVCALAGTVALVIYLWRTSKASQTAEPGGGEPDATGSAPRTIEQLRGALASPGYHPSRLYRRLKKSIVETAAQKTHWIGLSGPEAIGKSAAAQLLVEEIQRNHPMVLILMARCSESVPPFQPFKDALMQLGASAGLIATNSQMGDVNTFFDRLADEFIPFWNFFSSDSDDEEQKSTARHDLFEGVSNIINRMTEQRPVLLWLDDVQHIDPGSATLLRDLHERFHPGSEKPLTVILTSRETSTFDAFGSNVENIRLEPPSSAEQIHFLRSQLGINPLAADHLVKSLGVMSQQPGSLLWLIRTVSQLVQEDALSPSATGFVLNPKFAQKNRLPIPEIMRAKLRASLQAANEFLPVLECASLLGMRFRIDDVAQTLKMDRLRLLQILRHLEQELQLVGDVVNDDACYAFSSEFMLQMVREELGVSGLSNSGIRSGSKIAKELHARIALVLESRQPRTSQLIYEIAQHYHAAGETYVEESFKYALAAAEAAANQRAFQKARTFLQLAKGSSLTRQHQAELQAMQLSIRSAEGSVS